MGVASILGINYNIFFFQAGNTALQIAWKNKHFAIVKELLLYPSADANTIITDVCITYSRTPFWSNSYCTCPPPPNIACDKFWRHADLIWQASSPRASLEPRRKKI